MTLPMYNEILLYYLFKMSWQITPTFHALQQHLLPRSSYESGIWVIFISALCFGMPLRLPSGAIWAAVFLRILQAHLRDYWHNSIPHGP